MFGNVYIKFYDFIQLFFKNLFSPNLIMIVYAFLWFSCLYKTSVFSGVMFYFWYLLYSAVYCDSFSLGEVGGSCFKAGCCGLFFFPEWCIFWGVLTCGLAKGFERSVWPSAKSRFFTPVLQEWKNPNFSFLIHCLRDILAAESAVSGIVSQSLQNLGIEIRRWEFTPPESHHHNWVMQDPLVFYKAGESLTCCSGSVLAFCQQERFTHGISKKFCGQVMGDTCGWLPHHSMCTSSKMKLWNHILFYVLVPKHTPK